MKKKITNVTKMRNILASQICWLCAIALVVVIAFSMAACDVVNDDNKNDGNNISDINKDYDYTETNGKITITRYKGAGGNVTIPSNIGGKPVIGFGNAFAGNKNITGVIIPDSVTSIGQQAFNNCTNLTSVNLGNSVTNIGDMVFYNCTSLISVIIPDSVTNIGDAAFSRTGLTSVNIPNSVTSIGSSFKDCTSLVNVTIGNGVIGKSAFESCTSLTSVTIGNRVTSIEWLAFSGCTGLTGITIPNSVTSLNGFTGCTGLTSVIIPSSVTSIGNGAFARCINLTSVTFQGTIPSSGFAQININVNSEPFMGDLRNKFYVTDSANGTPGTYTRSGSGTGSSPYTWTKQE